MAIKDWRPAHIVCLWSIGCFGYLVIFSFVFMRVAEELTARHEPRFATSFAISSFCWMPFAIGLTVVTWRWIAMRSTDIPQKQSEPSDNQ